MQLVILICKLCAMRKLIHEEIDTVVHQLFVDYPVVETAGLDTHEVAKQYGVDEEIASRALEKAMKREQSHFGRHLDY